MATSRLKLYNRALSICGETVLAALTENRKPRHLLDQAWDADVVKEALENGQWRFARRTQRIDYDPDITPEFGPRRAFGRPSDWCATCALSASEYMTPPLLAVREEGGHWYADVDEIYLSYVSDGSAYGGDYSLWPVQFAEYVATMMAGKIVLSLTADKARWQAILHPRTGSLRDARLKARNHDSMGEPVRFPPPSSWLLSRGGRRGRGTRSDGGSTGSLTG